MSIKRKIFKSISPFKTFQDYLFFLKNRLLIAKNDNALNLSFSQEGEDLLIEQLFMHYLPNKKTGFYIDVGACNPLSYSNTMKLYVNGWRGINIDATPGSMRTFYKLRPEDINIEAALSSQNSPLKFFEFYESPLNTFSSDIAMEYVRNGYKIKKTHTLNTYTINELLDIYLPKNQEIDFIDIDIEGLDEDIINSFDFDRFSPNIVMTETTFSSNDISETIQQHGYVLRCRTYRNDIYVKASLINENK